MKIDNSVKDNLKQQIKEQSILHKGAGIPLFDGYIAPFQILNNDSVSFLRERAMTILNKNNSNFMILKNTRDNDGENQPVDFINFPVLEVVDQVKDLLEKSFGAKVVSEYVLLSRLARLDKHKDYTESYFKDEKKPNHYKVPVGVSIFLGPDGGSPLSVYLSDKTVLQDKPGSMMVFGPTIEHDHPKGHDSYYIVYQPTLEFEVDCGCK